MKIRKIIYISMLLFVCTLVVRTTDSSAAGSTDINNPTVLSYTGYSGGHASGYLETDSSDQYFRFTLGTTSYYSDLTAIILTVPSGCDYQIEVSSTSGGFYEVGAYSLTSNNKIVKIEKPQSATTYNIHLYSLNGVYSSTSQYDISIEKALATGAYTGNFSPSKITNAGGAIPSAPTYSTVTSINLTNVNSIPNTAQVTSATVKGTLSRNIGNTWMELANAASGVMNTGILSKGSDTHFGGYLNSYDPVKTLWTMDYFTYAGYSTTFSSAKLVVEYRYDKYENF